MTLSDLVRVRYSTMRRETFDLSVQGKVAGSVISCTRMETLSVPPALGVPSSAMAEPITRPPSESAIA